MKPECSVVGRAVSLIYGVGLIILLAGCSSQPEPEALWPAPEQKQQQRTVTSSARVVDELLTTAEQHRQQENWQALIDVAEQGVRINRRLPHWYLLLAESYAAQAQPQQARRFVDLGRRYCRVDASVCAQLVQLSKTLHITQE